MNDRAQNGFSLIELCIVILIMGMLLGFTLPAFKTLSGSYQLKGSSENIAAQLRLAREKAIGSGTSQQLVFSGLTQYRAMAGGNTVERWTLPRGIQFHWSSGTDSTFTLSRDGRADKSALVIVQDAKGQRDTVSVQLSGLVLTQ